MQGDKEISVEFLDSSRTVVTKGVLLQTLIDLDSSIWDGCTIHFEGRFLEDKTDDPAIDNSLLVEALSFTLNNKVVSVAPVEQRMKEDNILIEGRYFTQKDFDEKRNVCLVSINKPENYEGEAVKWAEKYGKQNDGSYIVDGKRYTCIGYVDTFSTVPMVPITTISDDVYIQRVVFEFVHPITSKKYLAIKDALVNVFGEHVQIPNIEIKELDSDRFYNSLLLLCIGLFTLSALIVSVLYQYIILKRKRNIVIYRLCGMTLRNARIMYVLECLLISFFMFVLGTAIFHYGLLPKLSESFEFILYSYHICTYILLLGIYIVVSLCVLGFMIVRQTRGNIKRELMEV